MGFEVIPSTVPVTVEEWLHAKNVALHELPSLNDSQRSSAKQLRVGEENYRRFHVFLREQVRERQRKQGEAFGRVIERMLLPLGAGLTLEKISRVAPPDAWKVAIRDARGVVVEFWSLFEVVDALIQETASGDDMAYFQAQLMARLSESMPLGVTG